jgi:hypothetical protein
VVAMPAPPAAGAGAGAAAAVNGGAAPQVQNPQDVLPPTAAGQADAAANADEGGPTYLEFLALFLQPGDTV